MSCFVFSGTEGIRDLGQRLREPVPPDEHDPVIPAQGSEKRIDLRGQLTCGKLLVEGMGGNTVLQFG